MVDDPRDAPLVSGLVWHAGSGGNVEHIAAHEVEPQDVEEVLTTAPRFFASSGGRAGCVMLGPNRKDRYLLAVLVETEAPSVWCVVTAYWMSHSRTRRIYDRETIDGQER